MTKEFVFPLDVDDLVSLPITKDQVEAHIERLDGPALESLLNLVVVTPFVKEFMGWHIRSGHIPFPKMFSLCENGYLPKCFLALKKEKLVCPSCVFGKDQRQAWRTKSALGSLAASYADKPGAHVSVDHVVSAQPAIDVANSGISTFSYTNLVPKVAYDCHKLILFIIYLPSWAPFDSELWIPTCN